MSELLQAGQHPDADQLSAFVEHMLPAHEQQQTLAHLSICPDCRQIVALSLPPADQSPSLEPEAVRHRWFPRWHPAWAGIPSLAALILAVLLVRHEQRNVPYTSVVSQVADARKPAPPPPAEIPPPEALRSMAPLGPQAPKSRPVAPAAPRPQARQGAAIGVMGGVAGNMGGILGGIATSPMQPPAPAFAASSASVAGPMTALAVNRVQAVLSTPGPLPSHLDILSMASHGNQRLAIDTHHHLFFSNDEGRNWKAVLSPWKGRAVNVAVTSSVSFGSARAVLKVTSHPAPTTASTLSGAITDPAGAVIPGATLTATNSSGVLVGSATTDSRGQYRMENLSPGSYRIEAQASGFEKQSFATQVAPAQQAVADATLRVGSAAQTVNIQASPAPRDTPSAEEKQALTPAVGQPLSRFELTTDDGEHWMSIDGQNWTRK
jgi:Carboxypeptidase regulatory-like domain/Putative zinc-finger